jgi:hypothetical protein
MFELRVKTGNAAFEDDPKYELVRILLDVVQKIQNDYDCGYCMDINGNKVGEWKLRR